MPVDCVQRISYFMSFHCLLSRVWLSVWVTLNKNNGHFWFSESCWSSDPLSDPDKLSTDAVAVCGAALELCLNETLKLLSEADKRGCEFHSGTSRALQRTRTIWQWNRKSLFWEEVCANWLLTEKNVWRSESQVLRLLLSGCNKHQATEN